MLLAFNELSLKNDFLTNNSPRDIVDKIVIFLREIKNLNILDELLLIENQAYFALPDYYNFGRWLKDETVNTTHKQYLRRFLDKHCCNIQKSEVEGDFNVNNKKEYSSFGCAIAVEREIDVFSAPTNSAWSDSVITGEYITLSDDDAGNDFKHETHKLKNLTYDVPIKGIEENYKIELQSNIASGQDLWDNREKLYPNLVFCQNVKTQLINDSEKFHITAVMKKLERLQAYFSNCDDKYDPKELGMDARTESESVKNDPKLKEARLFQKPDGTSDYFYDHVSFHGKYSAGRIHFLPDSKNRRCYIGYIGKHLETKKF